MGQRTLKRVPIDFDAPINEVWEGYVNPHRPPERCTVCEGSGLNKETKQLEDDYYTYSNTKGEEGWSNDITQDEVQALVDRDRLFDFIRVPINDEQREVVRKKVEAGGNSLLPYNNGYLPTPEEVNEWNKNGMGHDGINRWILVKTRAKRLGIWGECDQCKGSGEIYKNRNIEKLWNEWEGYDPPAGEGYQLWETTSEGSPQSPVFENPEDLAEWCEDNATVFANDKTSKENWLKMFVNDSVDTGTLVIGTSAKYLGAAINEKNN